MLSDNWQPKSRDQQRFWQLSTGVWVAALTGVLYAFGIVSDEMKERFHFSQEDLTTISTVGFVSCIFGFSGGYTWDRWGPTHVLVISALMISSSFFILGLTFAERIPVSIPLLSFSQAVAALGIVWGDVGSLMTNMLNFPLNQGAIVLIQKTWMGLGGTVFAVIYIGWFNHRPESYCYFVSFFILVGYLPAILWLRVPKGEMLEKQKVLNPMSMPTLGELKEAEDQKDFLQSTPADNRRFRVAYVLLAFMLFFLVATTSANAVYEVPPALSSKLAYLGLIVIVVGYGSMAWIPFSNVSRGGKGGDGSSSHDGAAAAEVGSSSISRDGTITPPNPTTTHKRTRSTQQYNGGHRGVGTTTEMFAPHDWNTTNNTTSNMGSPSSTSGGTPLQPPMTPATPAATGRKYETTFWESLKHPDIWLLWWSSFCMWGTGKTLALNCPQIYRAVNNDEFKSSTNALYVAMVGVGGALGRMAVGLAEQYLINPSKITVGGGTTTLLEKKPRGFFAASRNGAAAGGEWITTHLYPPCAVVVVLGCVLFLVVPPSLLALPFVITAGGYGCSWAATVLLVPQMFTKDLGKHYNFLFSSMISIIFFNRGVFGTSFSHEAAKQGNGTHCAGPVCIRLPMVVMAVFNGSAIFTCVMVHRRWKKFRSAGSTSSSSMPFPPPQLLSAPPTASPSPEHNSNNSNWAQQYHSDFDRPIATKD